ncbi:hypothetical protein FF1_045781 [Malus domestica]
MSPATPRPNRNNSPKNQGEALPPREHRDHLRPHLQQRRGLRHTSRPQAQASSQKDFEQAENPVIGFFRDLGGDSDDFRDSDDDDENDDGRKSFFRPIGSPSPGSSVPCSATSNDDSGGDLKTPTAARLVFEEKTPTHNTNVTDSGSLMSLTKPKMVTLQSSVPADKVRSGEDSNDMSIIEENPHKYDYGRLSPILDALLAAGSKDMHADSVAVPATSMAPNGGEVSASDENGIGHMRNGRTTEMGNFGTNDLSTEVESVSCIKLSESNGGYLHQTAYDASSNGNHNSAAGDSGDGQIQTQNQLNNVRMSLAIKILIELLPVWFDLIHSKSISRFTLPEPSPCASIVNDGMEKLKCSLSSYSSVNSPLKNVMADIDRDLQCKFSNSPTACLEKQTAMPDLNEGQKSLFNMNSNGNENSINTSMLSQVNETTDRDKVEEPQPSMFTYTPLKDAYGTRRNAVVSPSQLSLSGSKMTQHLMSETPTEGALISSGTDSLLAGEQEDNPPHLQIESEKNFQSPSRGAVILNNPDNSIQGGAAPMHSKPYICSSTTEPYLHSPSSK